MRAARLHEISGPLHLDEVDRPVAGVGQVVVDMAYASVNPLDVWITQGNVGVAGANLPWTPGTEGTGYVDGRPVFVRGGGIGVMRQGLYAEQAVVPSDAVEPLADDRQLAELAGLGVAGVTAWNAVHVQGHVVAGDRVVVLGASGGVGSLAVQLAKATGATVWGQSGSPDKVAGIVAGGADHAFVAAADGLATSLADFAPTVVLDALGGPYTAGAIDALAVGGRLVVYGTSAGEVVTFNMRTMYRKGLTISGYTGLVEPADQARRVMAGLIEQLIAGSIRVPVELVPLADAATAHRRIVDRQVTGKLVLDIRAH